MIIKKIATIDDYGNIYISFRVKNKVFKYKYGDFQYIEYFNEINLKNYNIKYFVKQGNKLNNIQYQRYVNNNLLGISLIKQKKY
jgi:hypothetical protein